MLLTIKTRIELVLQSVTIYPRYRMIIDRLRKTIDLANKLVVSVQTILIYLC